MAHAEKLKRRKGPIVVALLLLAGLTAVVWIAVRDHDDANRLADRTKDAGPRPAQDPAAGDKPSPDPREVESREDSSAPADGTEEPVDQFPGVRDHEIPRDVELRFTEGGKPVPHLAFSFQVLDGIQVADFRRGSATLALRDAATDQSGKWTTRVPYWSTIVVQLDGMVFARDYFRRRHHGLPQSADYAYVMVSMGVMLDDDYVAELRSGAKQLPPRKVDLAVTRIDELFVEIVFEDGQPYEGEVKWGSYTNGSFNSSGWSGLEGVEHAEAGRVTLPAPLSNYLRVTITPVQRDGYQRSNIHDLAPDELASGVIRLTIPADPDRPLMRGIEVDHTALEPDEKAYITLFGVVSKSVRRNWVEVSGPGVYRSDDLNTSAYLICMVTSRSIHDAPTPGWRDSGTEGDTGADRDEPGFAWSSGVFQLEPGEWRRLTFERQTAAGLKVRAVDPEGDPIDHAALRHTSHWPTAFFEPRFSVGGLYARIASEEADGRLTLHSIPPGEHEFTVEGRGYEPHHVSVTLAPGQTLDLGNITLQPATAVVRVKLIGASIPPDNYQAFLSIGAGFASQIRPFPEDGGLLEFHSVTSLSDDRYYIFAQRVEGGRGWHSRRFSIAPGEVVTVEVDVSKPFAGPEGGRVSGASSSPGDD